MLEQFLEETEKLYDKEFPCRHHAAQCNGRCEREHKSFLLSKIKEAVALDREECARKIEELEKYKTISKYSSDGVAVALIDRDEAIKILRG